MENSWKGANVASGQKEEIEKKIRLIVVETERNKFQRNQKALKENIRIRVNKEKREFAMKKSSKNSRKRKDW